MRNSSLVEGLRAENVTGLKHITETTGLEKLRAFLGGRGAFCSRMKAYREECWTKQK